MIEYLCPRCGQVNELNDEHFTYTDFVDCVHCQMWSMKEDSTLNDDDTVDND